MSPNAFDQLFDQFFRPFPVRPFEARLADEVEVKQLDAGLELHVDLPGVRAEDVDIEVHEGILRVRAQRDLQTEAASLEGWKVLRSERRRADLDRSWRLPESIDGEKIEAKLVDGHLVLTLPKREAKRARKIELAA